MKQLHHHPELIEFESWDDVPSSFSSEEEEAEWWATHAPGAGILDNLQPVLDHGLPPPRTRDAPTSVRFDADTLARVRALAARRGLGYQTLLKQFVCERLYEEEKRDGILS